MSVTPNPIVVPLSVSEDAVAVPLGLGAPVVAGVTMVQRSVTLQPGDWSSNSQVVSVQSVTENNAVLVAYAPESKDDYTLADIYCSEQGNGTLTFTCSTVPTSAITVNVMILNA